MKMMKNSLIERLPKSIQDLIESKSEVIEMKISQILCVTDKPIDYLYFPLDGFFSITQRIDEKTLLEIGMVGREGVLGSEALLGMTTNSFGAIVQGAGYAQRINLEDFMAITVISADLERVIKQYLCVRISQLGLSACCEHYHEIGPRLAKWLLMSQDRAQAPIFSMTHEFISLMLGVRRVGITTTAADFRRRGLIEYRRGEIKILNRVALKSESCSCYQKNRKIYLSQFP